MRVPSPAAGRITKTCMALRVYNLAVPASLHFHVPSTQSAHRRRSRAIILSCPVRPSRNPRSNSGPHSVPGLPLDISLLKPGMRLAVGALGRGGLGGAAARISGATPGVGPGAPCRAPAPRAARREADGDLEFCRELAAKLGLPFHEARVDTAPKHEPMRKSGKPAESIEEAARRLRYSWFEQLMSKELLDAITTAHTLDDQAETVLAKFLRGAWTEGLAGISPKLEGPEGAILRPLLHARRSDIEAYLNALGQTWREDSSNRHLTFTRNRIRHELLPLLEGWNPKLREHLAQMAELAHDEEAWWQAELARLAPQIAFAGASGAWRRPRCGWRPPAAGLALEVSRLAALAPAVRAAAPAPCRGQFGVALDFAATEALRSLALDGRAGQKLALPQGLCAERTARELRLSVATGIPLQRCKSAEAGPTVHRADPRRNRRAGAFGAAPPHRCSQTRQRDPKWERGGPPSSQTATLRNWKPGDRVQAALLQWAAQSEGSAGTQASYGNRPGALAGAGGRWAHRLDAGCGVGARAGPYDRRCGDGARGLAGRAGNPAQVTVM
jgi:tRNA(Ile)-lysidine synthase